MIKASSSERFERVLRRRAPQDIFENAKLSAAKETSQGDATRFLVNAMKPIDRDRTDRLRAQGTRVEEQLRQGPGRSRELSFRRQGSVSNDTHILHYSDVDVLVIVEEFFTLESPQVPLWPYRGSPVDVLRSVRDESFVHLKAAFPAVNVDNTGRTAISMSGGSLACKVDVVPANWFNTKEFARTTDEKDRGIQVLDYLTGERTKNQPFLFNFRLGLRDREMTGRLRQIIRLLKTIKADLCEENEDISLSSFDLCSICYRMPSEYYRTPLLEPLALLENVEGWLRKLNADSDLRKSLNTVDDSRAIFRKDRDVDGLRLIQEDLDERINEARRETRFIKLSTVAPFGDNTDPIRKIYAAMF